MNGIFRLYGKALPTERTYIVLGVARGGTSMIASTLRSLGVFIGDNLGAVNIEDLDFRELWLEFDEPAISAFARKRDSAYPVWGVKFPRMTMHLDTVGRVFRNPHYIVVTRDPLAVSGRKKEMVEPRNFLYVQERYAEIFRFLEEQQQPTMMVCYERVINSPETLCQSLAEFCGIADQSLIDSAQRNLRIDHLAYENKDSQN